MRNVQHVINKANRLLSHDGYEASVSENLYDRKRLAEMVQFRLNQMSNQNVSDSDWTREYSSNRVHRILNFGGDDGFADMRPNEVAAWAIVLGVSRADLVRMGAGAKSITIDEAQRLLKDEAYIELVDAA